MQNQYEIELDRYKYLLKQQRVAWLLLAITAVSTVIASEFVSINYNEGAIYLSPLIFLFLISIAMGQRIVFYKCPKCKKHMTTKYMVLHNLNTKACVHCGLEIYHAPEPPKITKKSTGDEWLK